jgi:predicted nucleic acid-binding protein
VIVAAMASWHERHEAAAEALVGVRAVPAHALLESYSVLTRLPGGLAVPSAEAARVLDARFGEAPLRLDAKQRRRLLATLAEAQVHGGASYDALVGLEAAAHDRTLITLDERAQLAYRRLGVAFRAL